ncbi:ABC1-domain-containing protein [Trichodelitschia bisporula]|uniref:ABC1-domain-containing protein n=1 Tax=Trichodelitschia bisporula TaxID=703511 RepID=A0A6G1I8N5_9PEZI|nr:ABC1-domain-containing protein [Trichodelitschia bisporula]
MAGRRLLDVAKLFNASRSIAKQHIVLRSNQIDVYNKTSSLAKAVKDQTDRVTLTAKAAIELAKRLDESGPVYPSAPGEQDGVQKDRSAQHATYGGPQKENDVGQAFEKEYKTAASVGNSTADPVPQREFIPEQAEESGNTLPDGTFIPPNVEDALASAAEGSGKQSTAIPSSVSPAATPSFSKATTSTAAKGFQRQAEAQIPSVTTAGTRTGQSELENGHDQDVYYAPSTEVNTNFSSLPRTKIPKNTSGFQGSTSAEGLNQDVFYTPTGAQKPISGQETFKSTKSGALEAHSASDMRQLASDIAQETLQSSAVEIPSGLAASPLGSGYQLKESRVPSTRLGRLWQYGSLATGMAFGVVGEGLRRVTGGGDSGGSMMLSPGNMERLVAKLSRMRGAALKLGQMISFQDLKMLPPSIHEVLRRVQDSADYMPAFQRDKVLASNLGSDWRDIFSSFDEVPIAAASIGQVHRAVLKSTGMEVAVKVQYPGVAQSINSDLNNLSILLTASRLLPKGLFLDKTIANAQTELAWECDYLREADCARRFKKLLEDDTDVFTVPEIIPEASGREVLTAELMQGSAVTKLPSLTQEQRDWIGMQILRLCLREICEFKFMQTDPNWTNFLYNPENNKLELLDFGASREYPDEFVDPYIKVLEAASRHDRNAVAELSIQLGYLTGAESMHMRNAHIDSVLTLAEPFTNQAPEEYDFRDQTITDRVRSLIPLMVKERLAPPPEETYSLHRKLSGAFLLCANLGSKVRCRELFRNAIKKYSEGRP